MKKYNKTPKQEEAAPSSPTNAKSGQHPAFLIFLNQA